MAEFSPNPLNHLPPTPASRPNPACYLTYQKDPMRTRNQIEAPRANGRESRGAVTPGGKARIVNADLWNGSSAALLCRTGPLEPNPPKRARERR